ESAERFTTTVRPSASASGEAARQGLLGRRVPLSALRQSQQFTLLALEFRERRRDVVVQRVARVSDKGQVFVIVALLPPLNEHVVARLVRTEFEQAARHVVVDQQM